MTVNPTHLREVRTPLGGVLRYRCEEPGDTGAAQWCNVSRGGASLRIGRYLRPGRWVTLEFASPLAANADLAVRARVVWCRPEPGAVEFVAGLAVLRETAELALDFAALGYAARRGANSGAAAGVDGAWNPDPLAAWNEGNEWPAGGLLPAAV